MRMWRRRASLSAGSRSMAFRMSSKLLMGVVIGGPLGSIYILFPPWRERLCMHNIRCSVASILPLTCG